MTQRVGRGDRSQGRIADVASVVAFALLLGGCPDAGGGGGTLERDAEGRTPPVPEAAETPLQEVRMREMEGSGITGAVRVLPRGGETQLTVSISGAHPNALYPARLHTGRCEEQGAERAPLEPIRTDAAGQGASRSVVPIPAHEVMTGRDYVQVYVARGDLHQAVACGELPERPDLVPALDGQP
jgi:hypothetical protein